MMTKFHYYDVLSSFQEAMNSSRGVKSCWEFLGMEEAAIVDGMSIQRLVAARCITRLDQGEYMKSASVILTSGKPWFQTV